jgi:hypothetical protein
MQIFSMQKGLVWPRVLTRVPHRVEPGATQCDEPEQQYAPDQLAIDMMHPSGL